MKKLSVVLALIIYSNLFSQKTVNGKLFFADYNLKIISEFNGEHFYVDENNSYSVINKTGDVVLKNIQTYGLIGRSEPRFFNGFLTDYSTEKDAMGLYRILSTTDKKDVSDYKYSHVIPLGNSTILTIEKKEYTYLDKDLNVIYKFIEDDIKKKFKYDFNESFSHFGKVSSSEFKSVFGAFSNGLSKFANYKVGKYGFIDKSGKMVIEPKYDHLNDFSEGYASFGNSDRMYGFINTKGEVVIPAVYSNLPYSFNSGLAKVMSKDNLFGFINTKNKLIIPAKYKYATNFYKNHALVRESTGTPILLINQEGEIVTTFNKDYYLDSFKEYYDFTIGDLNYLNPTLKQIMNYNKGIFKKGLRYGLLDMNGNVVLDFKYASLKDYKSGMMLAVWKTGNEIKQGLINDEGDFVVEVVESKF